MNPKLSLEISADVSKMDAALKKADAMLKQHERNYKGVQDAISKNSLKSAELERSISKLSNEYNKGGISQAKYTKETDRLTGELAQVNNETGDFQRELKRLEGEMKRTANAARNLDDATEQIGGATGQATAAVDKLGKTTKVNATPAMMSFSQVVQDAPYGIQGVANNIQQLTMQMGYLSKSAGGTGGALKALAGTLIGPAGILLAVSVVTSLLVKYGDKLFDTTSLTEELNSATKDLIGTAQSEIATLQALLNAARNENDSKEDRQRAINKINDLYGEYLPNLDLETIGTNKVTTAVDNLSKSLIRQAKIRGVQDLISKKAGEIAEKEAEAIEKAQERMIEARRKGNKIDPRTLPQGTSQEEIDSIVGKARDNLAGSIITEATDGAAKDAKKEMDMLAGYLQKLIDEDIDFKGVFSSVTPEGKKAKIDIEPVFEFDDSTKNWAETEIKILEDVSKKYGELTPQFQNLAIAIGMLKSATDGGTGIETLNESAKKATDDLAENWIPYVDKFSEVADKNDEIAKRMSEAISQMVSNMMFDLIEGKKGFEDFAKSILKALFGIGIQSLLGGAGGIFKVLGFSGGGIAEPKGFASGGVIGGSSFSGDKLWARVNSGEMILNQDQQKSLYSQLQAPSMVNSVATEPLEIVGTSVINGDQIQTVWSRAQNKRGRTT